MSGWAHAVLVERPPARGSDESAAVGALLIAVPESGGAGHPCSRRERSALAVKLCLGRIRTHPARPPVASHAHAVTRIARGRVASGAWLRGGVAGAGAKSVMVNSGFDTDRGGLGRGALFCNQ